MNSLPLGTSTTVDISWVSLFMAANKNAAYFMNCNQFMSTYGNGTGTHAPKSLFVSQFLSPRARWIMEKLIYEVLFENPTLKSLFLFAFRVKGFAEADLGNSAFVFSVLRKPRSLLRVDTCFPPLLWSMPPHFVPFDFSRLRKQVVRSTKVARN